MYIDSDNRIRFSRDGFRIYVSNSNVSVYSRKDGWEKKVTPQKKWKITRKYAKDISEAKSLLDKR